MPAVGWRFERPWGYLEPRTELWNTAYELDYGERDTQRSDSPSRSVVLTSIDSGSSLNVSLHWVGGTTAKP